jgi:hypothetical protein
MPSGWAVLCEVQFLRGYSLLLPDLVVPDFKAHIIPRYLIGPGNLRKGLAFVHDEEFRNSIRLDHERDRDLLEQVAAAIQARL